MDDTLITYESLTLQGLTPSEIRRQIKSGRLQKVRHGVYTYSRPPGVEQHLQLLNATLPAVDDGNVASHVTAGVLHGLPVQTSLLDRIWMTRRSSGHGDHAPKLVVRATSLFDDEVQLLNGRAVTTLARTATDIARTVPVEWGVVTVDAALAAGLSKEDLLLSLRRHPRLRGIRRARFAINFGDAKAESPAESISRLNMHRAGIPAPRLQVEHFDGDGVFVARTDFGWPQFNLVGEMDGKGKYGALARPGQSPESVLMEEKIREERLRQLGLWIVRWDWATANNQQALANLLFGAINNQTRQMGRLAG